MLIYNQRLSITYLYPCEETNNGVLKTIILPLLLLPLRFIMAEIQTLINIVNDDNEDNYDDKDVAKLVFQ